MEAGLITPINELKQIAINIVKQVTSGKDYWNDETVRTEILAESGKIDGVQRTLLTWVDGDTGNCDAETSLEDSKKILETIKDFDAYIIFYMFNEPLFTRLSEVLTQMNNNITNLTPSIAETIKTLIEKAVASYKIYNTSLQNFNSSQLDSFGKNKLRSVARKNYDIFEEEIQEIITKLDTLKKTNKSEYDEVMKLIKTGPIKLYPSGNHIITLIVNELDPNSKKLVEFSKFMAKALDDKLSSEISETHIAYSTSASIISDKTRFLSKLKKMYVSNADSIDSYLSKFDSHQVMLKAYNESKVKPLEFQDNFPFKFSQINAISLESLGIELDDLSIVIEYSEKITLPSEQEYMIIVWCKSVILDLYETYKAHNLEKLFARKGGNRIRTKNKRRITNYTRKNLL